MKTTKFIPLIAAAMGAALLAGCSTISSRIEADPQAFNQLAPNQQTLVRAGQIAVGFTPAAVRLALGSPDRVTLHTTASGQTEVWHYGSQDYYDYGPYWGPYWGWGWRWGGYGGAWAWDYPPPSHGPDRIRVEFKNGRVATIEQDKDLG
jgi:uncharacterized protein YceK